MSDTRSVTYTYNEPYMAGTTATLTRSTDGAFIPCVLDNSDYQAFLTWIAEGNTAPEGWTGPTNSTAPPEAQTPPPTS